MTASKWPNPKRGDIVLCKFPHDESPDAPGPAPRPALVLSVSEEPVHVIVCYGTGQFHHKNQTDSQFCVREEKHVKALGLHEGTMFDFAKTTTLPYDSAWFHTSPNKRCPKLGTTAHSKELKPGLFLAMKNAGLSHLLPNQNGTAHQTAAASEPSEQVAS